MVEKAESSFGASPAGVNYIRAVSLCSPLFRFVFLYSVSLCVSSCVPFMRLAHRLVIASRFHCLSWDTTTQLSYRRRFVLLAACRLVLRLVLGVCVSALYAAIASRHAVSCSMPFSRLCSAFRHACRPVSRLAACSWVMVSMRRRFILLAARFVMPCRAVSSCVFCSTFRLYVSSLRSVFSDCPLVAVPFGTVSTCSPLAISCRVMPDNPDEMTR